jgi:hypothetical protein
MLTQSKMLIMLRQYEAIANRYNQDMTGPVTAFAVDRVNTLVAEGVPEAEAEAQVQDILNREVRRYPVTLFPAQG